LGILNSITDLWASRLTAAPRGQRRVQFEFAFYSLKLDIKTTAPWRIPGGPRDFLLRAIGLNIE
jgi:hypothetical protein